MVNYTITPSVNTIQLITLLYLQNDYVWNITIIPIYILPTVGQATALLGMLAQSLASVSTAGYYSTATVPAVGESPKPVYIIHIYILILVLVANAMRGVWWDQELRGGCILRDSKINALSASSEVIFGLDFNNTEHVGLAPRVLEIQEHVVYYRAQRRALETQYNSANGIMLYDSIAAQSDFYS
ncbi:hypothetical protein BGZ61DRAFT_486789 [Ilyonectria robusta]|uniref:uncharacterized protein n=1 Tax=Ilyonectria robusta TaxID=1079257 RepID=UPI001E8ECBDB|nr:uncharacterized protein BGZ61DRAFT_486789 [Ilyonectria robusta]KAH8654890.1 hypothetical protein BGZ61DRAFT_486789 [Ilyonectria robusta]